MHLEASDRFERTLHFVSTLPYNVIKIVMIEM